MDDRANDTLLPSPGQSSNATWSYNLARCPAGLTAGVDTEWPWGVFDEAYGFPWHHFDRCKDATQGSLKYPSDVVVGTSGLVYIADSGNNRIRRLNTKTNTISTVMGNGDIGYRFDECDLAVCWAIKKDSYCNCNLTSRYSHF